MTTTLRSWRKNRIGFVVVKQIQHREKEKGDSENDSGSSSLAPRSGFRRYGPRRTLAGNQRARSRFLYEGFERE